MSAGSKILLLVAVIMLFSVMREQQFETIPKKEPVKVEKEAPCFTGKLERVMISKDGTVATENMRLYPNTILKVDGSFPHQTLMLRAGETRRWYEKTEVAGRRTEFKLRDNGLHYISVTKGDFIKITSFPFDVYFHAEKF